MSARFYIFLVALIGLFTPITAPLYSQSDPFLKQSPRIQISGLALTDEGNDPIPYIGVFRKNYPEGTLTNENGLFHMVCAPGDTILLTGLGYQATEYVVPINALRPYVNVEIKMIQDTFYLPEAVIRPYMTEREFLWEMEHGSFTDDMIERAKKNVTKDVMMRLLANLPKNSLENQAQTQRYISQEVQNKGIINNGTQLFNPFNWMKFYESVKNGDYKKKNKY